MSHIKSLQSINQMATEQEYLCCRPEGLPLATVKEFKTFDSDVNRLRTLVSSFITEYLKKYMLQLL